MKTLEKEIGRVRGFRPDDAPMIAELCRRSVEAAGPIHYSREQVNAWLSVLPSADEILARYSDGRMTVIAVGAADRPVAFADLEADGHIQYFYCAPEVMGGGVGTAAMSRLLSAGASLGQRSLRAEASEPALGFFQRHGFEVLTRRDLTIGTVNIHNYAVARSL